MLTVVGGRHRPHAYSAKWMLAEGAGLTKEAVAASKDSRSPYIHAYVKSMTY